MNVTLAVSRKLPYRVHLDADLVQDLVDQGIGLVLLVLFLHVK